jgi:hypothetical protein
MESQNQVLFVFLLGISGLQLRRVCRCNVIYPLYLGVAPVTYTRMSGDTDKPCTIQGPWITMTTAASLRFANAPTHSMHT